MIPSQRRDPPGLLRLISCLASTSVPPYGCAVLHTNELPVRFCRAAAVSGEVPDMAKRQTMNLLLLGAVGLPVSGLAIPYGEKNGP